MINFENVSHIVEIILVAVSFVVGYVRLQDKTNANEKNLSEFKEEIRDDLKIIKNDIKEILKGN